MGSRCGCDRAPDADDDLPSGVTPARRPISSRRWRRCTIVAASHLAFAASANNDPLVTLQALALRATVLANSPSSLFLSATAHDKLHHTKQATDLYKQFLSVANGQFPDEEWEARHRLITLEHMK